MHRMSWWRNLAVVVAFGALAYTGGTTSVLLVDSAVAQTAPDPPSIVLVAEGRVLVVTGWDGPGRWAYYSDGSIGVAADPYEVPDMATTPAAIAPALTAGATVYATYGTAYRITESFVALPQGGTGVLMVPLSTDGIAVGEAPPPAPLPGYPWPAPPGSTGPSLLGTITVTFFGQSLTINVGSGIEGEGEDAAGLFVSASLADAKAGLLEEFGIAWPLFALQNGQPIPADDTYVLTLRDGDVFTSQ